MPTHYKILHFLKPSLRYYLETITKNNRVFRPLITWNGTTYDNNILILLYQFDIRLRNIF